MVKKKIIERVIKIFYPGRFYCPTDYILSNKSRYNQRIDEKTGYLDVSIYDNATNAPIEGATVVISSVSYSGEFYEFGRGRVIHEYKTNENGKAPIIELPIHNELMKTHDHNFYIISVYTDGFYDAHLFHIQIFDNETTNFKIYLSRAVGDQKKFDIIIQPTTNEVHSR